MRASAPTSSFALSTVRQANPAAFASSFKTATAILDREGGPRGKLWMRLPLEDLIALCNVKVQRMKAHPRRDDADDLINYAAFVAYRLRGAGATVMEGMNGITCLYCDATVAMCRVEHLAPVCPNCGQIDYGEPVEKEEKITLDDVPSIGL